MLTVSATRRVHVVRLLLLATAHGLVERGAEFIQKQDFLIENQRSAKLVRCASPPDGVAKALVRVLATPEVMTIYKAAGLGL